MIDLDETESYAETGEVLDLVRELRAARECIERVRALTPGDWRAEGYLNVLAAYDEKVKSNE